MPQWLQLALATGVLLEVSVAVPVAFAADVPASVGLVRATGPQLSTDVAEGVDAALLRELDVIGITSPIVSPTEYEEVQLAVGCQDDSRNCLAAIARTLHVEALLLRRLERSDAGGTALELVYLDGVGEGGPPVRARAEAPAGGASDIIATVAGLTREIFRMPAEPTPAPSEPAPPVASPTQTTSPPLAVAHAEPPDGARDHGVAIGTLTWVTLVSGAAVLGTGAIVGLTASQSFADLEEREIRTPEDAERANDDFGSIETRATVANVLMPVGGAALAAGVVLLVLDLSSAAPEERAEDVALRVSPLRGGVALALGGTFGGR